MPKTKIHKQFSSLARDWVFSRGRTFGIADRTNDTSILPWHDHAFMEIYVIYRGRAMQKTLRKKESILKGDILFFNVNEPHSAVPGPDFSYFVLALTPASIQHLPSFIDNESFMRQSGIDRFLSGKSGGYGKAALPLKDAAAAASHCRSIHAELTAGNGDGIASLALYSLLAHAARSSVKRTKAPPVDERITRIMEHIQAHPDGDLSAETLASMTSLNKSYLSRLFSQTTKYTISDYIAEVRIEHACRLLRSSDLPVYRVAERSGYSDLSSFHEKFRSFNGKTPAEYRDKYRTAK